MNNERRQLLIAAGAAVFVSLLFFVLMLKPKMNEIAKTRDDIQSEQQQEETLKNSLSRLHDVQEQAPLAAAKVLAVSELLPSTADLPGFIRLVQDAATQSGTDLQSIAPSQPSALANATGVDTIAVSIVANSGFRRMQDFLARLENLHRVVEVTALSLAPQVDPLSGLTTLTATITMQMFVVHDGAKVVPGGAPAAAPAASPSPSASTGASP